MSHSIKQLIGHELGATDGEVGHLKDFYFDDQKWVVRYAVVDAGSWLAERQVLISPHAFGQLKVTGKIVGVNLTRKQIEKCPPIEAHKTVSRQYEEEYYRHYGWPGYWQGEGLWGVSPFPIVERPPKSPAHKTAVETRPVHPPADAHLRSTQSVTGYHLSTSEGIVGHVCDFMMDEQTWAIGQLVIKIGHRFSGREVLIPVGKVERISYEDSTIFVSLSKEAVEKQSEEPIASPARDAGEHPKAEKTRPDIFSLYEK